MEILTKCNCYDFLADPWSGRWTIVKGVHRKTICLIHGKFVVDGKEFVLLSRAKEYVFDLLNIPHELW